MPTTTAQIFVRVKWYSHHECLDEGVRIGRKVGVLGKQCVEAEREGDDEECTDDGELQEGLHHVAEHDHVETEEGKLPDVGELNNCFSTALQIEDNFARRTTSSVLPKLSYLNTFLKQWAIPSLFSFIFVFSNKHSILQQINVTKCPSSIWSWDSNP